MPLQTGEILRWIERCDAAEMKRRRDYYDYLTSKGPQDQTFEEHVAKYAALIGRGGVATAEQIAGLEVAEKTTLPAELHEFYRIIGRLHVPGVMDVFSVEELRGMRSMGLIDMMCAAWGNDRPEFDPGEGLIQQATIDATNAAYKCAGWIWSEPGYEGHDYVWFDREGRFGTTYYHQDDFDALYEESLLPMLERSPEDRTFSEIILQAFETGGRMR